MVIRVYTSSLSGNKEVKKRQQRVLMILDSKNVKYEVIDITEPGREADKDFMQTNSKSNGATIGDPNPRHPLPPQMFSDDEYCGDYDQFDLANENDKLEEFLKMEVPLSEDSNSVTNHVEETSEITNTVQTNGTTDDTENNDGQSAEVIVNGDKSREASKEKSPAADSQETENTEIVEKNADDSVEISEKKEDTEVDAAKVDESDIREVVKESETSQPIKDDEEKMEIAEEEAKSEMSISQCSKEPSEEKENIMPQEVVEGVKEKDKTPEKDLSPSEALIENEKAAADN